MNKVIDDVVTEVKTEMGLPFSTVDLILDSQFKTIEENIKSRKVRTVNLMYLGKIRPTSWYVKNWKRVNKWTKEEHEAIQKNKRDNNRLVQLLNKKQKSNESREGKNADM